MRGACHPHVQGTVVVSRCDDRASDINGMTVLEYRPNVRLDQGGDRYIYFNLRYAVCMRDTCIHMHRVLFVVSSM